MRVLLILLLLQVPVRVSAEDDRSSIYRGDVEFFLDQFESKAGHFFEQKGIEWDQVREWSHRELTNISSDTDHLRLCARLVARLRDGHAQLRGCRVEWPDESNGRKWRFPKIGMVLAGERALVTMVDPSLGIPIGSEIKRIEGRASVEWIAAKAEEWSDRKGYSTKRHALAQAAAMGLAGWEGTTFSVAFVRPDGSSEVRLVDRSLGEHSPVRFEPAKQLGRLIAFGENAYGRTTNGNGYIRLRNVPGDLPEQLDKVLPALADVPGMILDMRANKGGGCDHNAVFARFLPKGEFWGRIEGAGAAPYSGPLVVIVDALTSSAGETLSGQFAEDSRAVMIGPCATAGMSSQKVTIDAPSGLCSAYFSVRSNKLRFNRGRGIEGIGVEPHEIVPYTAEELARGVDSQLRRAEELLKLRKWPEHIDYEPPVSE